MFARKMQSMVTMVVVALVCSAAMAQPAPAVRSGDGQIEGSWLVEVDLLNPPPTLPEAFTALETYSRGGGMLTSNNMPQPLLGQGSWEKSGSGYTVSMVFFTRGENGAAAGTIEVRHSVTLNGDTYSGQGRAEIYDPSGVKLGSVAFNSAGRRLAVATP